LGLPPFAIAVAAALSGCPATATTTAYTPITGILIRSSSLVAGIGCGTGTDQVYQYGAFLSYVVDDAGDHGPAAYSGVFDCYSDGLFSNLPADDAGSLSFDLTIVAWNQASFPPALACDVEETDGGFPGCPGDSPSFVASHSASPNWTTTCTATQQSGVSVLAVCAPLVATGAPSGGDAGENGDAGESSDAGADDAGEDGAAPTPGKPIVVATQGFVGDDSGAYLCGTDYQTVRATYTAGGQSGIASAQCPAPLTITPTVAGDAYAITVELFQAQTAVAQSSCQATASATSPTTATCSAASAE
jgi:hypothetical protein